MTQTPPQRSSLEVLRAKIVEAVPDILRQCENECGSMEKCWKYQPITGRAGHADEISLADVLLSMQGKHNIIGVDYNGYFLDCDKDMNNITQSEEKWNLALPLELQPQPVIDFLTTILV